MIINIVLMIVNTHIFIKCKIVSAIRLRIVKRNGGDLTEGFWRRTGSSVKSPRSPWSPASSKFSSSNSFILLFTRPVAVSCRYVAARTCSCLNQITELKRCSFISDLFHVHVRWRESDHAAARTPADTKMTIIVLLKHFWKSCRSVLCLFFYLEWKFFRGTVSWRDITVYRSCRSPKSQKQMWPFFKLI